MRIALKMKWDCQVAKNLVSATFNCHWVLVWLGRSSVAGNLHSVGGGLGETLASWEAQKQADAVVPFRAQVGQVSQKASPR